MVNSPMVVRTAGHCLCQSNVLYLLKKFWPAFRPLYWPFVVPSTSSLNKRVTRERVKAAEVVRKEAARPPVLMFPSPTALRLEGRKAEIRYLEARSSRDVNTSGNASRPRRLGGISLLAHHR